MAISTYIAEDMPYGSYGFFMSENRNGFEERVVNDDVHLRPFLFIKNGGIHNESNSNEITGI